MTGNVSKVISHPPRERTIGSMRSREEGFTIPWAYDEKENSLNENFPISMKPGGSVTLFVRCILPGKYHIGIIDGAEW